MGQLLNNMSQTARDAFENALSKTAAEVDTSGFVNIAGDTMTGPLVLSSTLAANDDVTIGAGKNIILDTATGTKIGTATTQKLGFYNSTPVVKPTALAAQLTTVTFTAPGTPDFALQDLVQATGFGFATADEGNTTLSVIANLQTRLASLETKLQALGLLA
jgi:hypothetical protein